jgi:hypothetical protein
MTNENQAGGFIHDVRLHWSGKVELKTAYLRYGLVYTFILWFFALLGSLMLLPAALREHETVLDSPVFRGYLAGVYVFLCLYQLFVWIIVWRNAHNVPNIAWAYAAKIGVVFSAIWFVYRAVKAV